MMLVADVGFDGVVPTPNLSHFSFDRVTLHLVNLQAKSITDLRGFAEWFYVPNLGVSADAWYIFIY